jgi:hypothetical protein
MTAQQAIVWDGLRRLSNDGKGFLPDRRADPTAWLGM